MQRTIDLQVLIFADLVTSVLGQISNNEAAPLVIRIKFPPAEAGPYSLTVTATNDLSVCGLEVLIKLTCTTAERLNLLLHLTVILFPIQRSTTKVITFRVTV